MASHLLALIDPTLKQLGSKVFRELGSAWKMEIELEKLQSVFSTLQAVLMDAEESDTNNQATTDWLIKVKDATYDAGDILDEIATEALIREPMTGDESIVLRATGQLFDDLAFRPKIVDKIKGVLERLDAIASERAKFHLPVSIQSIGIDAGDCETSSLSDSLIYGRHEEKKSIIQLLMSDVETQRIVSVHAIYGMGGMGKTTLARLVYNDEDIGTHFTLRMWVFVAFDFSLPHITKAILQAATGEATSLTQLDALQFQLRKLLGGHRFLLVLDNVWSEDMNKWNRLQHLLSCGDKGSSVIVTTRMERVAKIVATDPTYIHCLKELSEEDCWSLFKECALGQDGDKFPTLEEIGKGIVHNCRGMPLAIKSTGYFLRFRRRETEWLVVKESQLWEIPECGGSILQSLRLSFNTLPLHAKQCFTYCAIFPRNDIISKEKLIQLWMANGFIPSKARMELEDVGEEIFNDLLSKSFFQEPVTDKFGNVIGCKMHDLMHGLAQTLGGSECAVLKVDTKEIIPDRARHFARHLSPLEKISYGDVDKYQQLRSLLFTNNCSSDPSFFSMLYERSHLSLRAVQCCIGKELPYFIGQCTHLRYLNISSSAMESLPESIVWLQNLQTLILSGCIVLQELPEGMGYIHSLRNLIIDGCPLKAMPIRMGRLTSLQVLSMFIVGVDFGQGIEELKDLKLKGNLQIKNLDVVKDSSDAQNANLAMKEKLDSLTLTWGVNPDDNMQIDALEILKGLQPHSNLKELVLQNYLGSGFPHWICDSLLPNLSEVVIENCKRCKYFPPLGRLALLKHLVVIGMNVEYLHGQFDGDTTVNAFPSLLFLRILSLPNLVGLTKVKGNGVFPHLQKLEVSKCQEFIDLPDLPMLKHLIIEMCGNLTLSPQLPRLQYLSLRKSNAIFEEEGLRGLSSLETLDIFHNDRLNSLTDGVRHLTSLKCLSLVHCPLLKLLPNGMVHLTSLSTLTISDCAALRRLPVGLQHLNNLKNLDIVDCPRLSEKCKREQGEEWQKIRNIPFVRIDGYGL